MWVSEGRVSFAHFFEYDDNQLLTPDSEGESFLECFHSLPTPAERFQGVRQRALEVVDALSEAEGVPLLSVFGPVGPRGLPDIFAAILSSRSGSRGRRYYCPEVEYAHRTAGHIDNWLTFECDHAALASILEENARIAWGMGIALAGYLVAEEAFPGVLRLTPFDPRTARQLASLVLFAFNVNNDFDELSIFVPDRGVGSIRQSLGM